MHEESLYIEIHYADGDEMRFFGMAMSLPESYEFQLCEDYCSISKAVPGE